MFLTLFALSRRVILLSSNNNDDDDDDDDDGCNRNRNAAYRNEESRFHNHFFLIMQCDNRNASK